MKYRMYFLIGSLGIALTLYQFLNKGVDVACGTSIFTILGILIACNMGFNSAIDFEIDQKKEKHEDK